MVIRTLAGAAALALAAGASAAISVSFAAGSANVERIFEISQGVPPVGGGGGIAPITISTVDGVEVDLEVDMGRGVGLVTQRAGFEAVFYVDSENTDTTGVTGAFLGDLQGSFRFFNPSNPADTLLVGFVAGGTALFVAVPGPTGGSGLPFLIAGALVGPGTSYFMDDPLNGSVLGFPGGGAMGDASFTLTNFITFDAAGVEPGGPVGGATGSFSGTLVPSSGTGVLSALAIGLVAVRRRR